jgi:FG-GAP-like repeat/Salmonella virulence plasmid 65kDa B protein
MLTNVQTGSKRRFWSLCMALVASVCGLAHANISVNSSGQAGTGFPIALPPGVSGMAPSLALAYSEGGANGPVGVGWSLQGVSQIGRCPANKVTDGAFKPVRFEPADKLCLDGQRLIQTDANGVPLATQTDDAAGVTGSTPREFRTEKDSFARIRAYGAHGGVAANGPTHFKVWTKNGQVYEYGFNNGAGGSNHPEALVVVAPRTTDAVPKLTVATWAVARVSDVVNNYINFRYVQALPAWGSGTGGAASVGREWRLAEIQYTGTASAAPSNKVIFAYQPKATNPASAQDASEAYHWDRKNVSTQRLAAVTTVINSANSTVLGAASGAITVRRYNLSYQQSSRSGRSLLSQVQECVGAAPPAGTPDRCLPPMTFGYLNPDAVAYAPNSTFGSSTSSLRNLKMLDNTTGNYGVLTGDFNGDGKTDVLRWSNTPSENQLHLSTGSGAFAAASAFGITSDYLFKADGCYYAVAADFNGDGITDILRVAKPGCSPFENLLFIATGNGAFSRLVVPAGIDLEQKKAIYTSYSVGCLLPNSISPASAAQTSDSQTSAANPVARVAPPADNFGFTPRATKPSPKAPTAAAITPGQCWQNNRTIGKRFHLLDVNGDGNLDIVTTIAPAYSLNSGQGPVPSEQQICWGETGYVGLCSRVYLGSSSGVFSATNIASNINQTSLYSDPPAGDDRGNPYWFRADIADLDGDGLMDILASYSGRWRSLGDGNFQSSPVQDVSQLCGVPIDFNGDGKADCLRPETTASNQTLTLSYGAQSSGPVSQFNLTGAGTNLYEVDNQGLQTVGVLVEDFDGDGRQDILRWTVASGHSIYLSNGDGSFRPAMATLLDQAGPLVALDGSKSFITGDFLGNGTSQFMVLNSNAPTGGSSQTGTNQLLARSGVLGPTDVLLSVTAPTGLVTRVAERQLLTTPVSEGGRYISDRGVPGKAAQLPMVDVQPPLYVVTKLEQNNGLALLTTHYGYKGMKADLSGRGMLGFRETWQESPAPGTPVLGATGAAATAPDGAVTVVSESLQQYPYEGSPLRSKSFAQALLTGPVASIMTEPGAYLSSSVNTYCEASVASPDATGTHCTVAAGTAKVLRPYLRKSVSASFDLNGAALPTITTVNSFNLLGDPTQILITTDASFAGALRTYTKKTTNTYLAPGVALSPNKTDGDNWVIGRLSAASVESTVPNLLAALPVAAGSSPTAAAIVGVPPSSSPPLVNPAVLQVILQLLLGD